MKDLSPFEMIFLQKRELIKWKMILLNRSIDNHEILYCKKVGVGWSWTDEESFALSDDSLDLVVDLWELVFNYWNSDDVSGGSTGSSQSLLGGDKYVWDVLHIIEKYLLFAENGEVEDDFEWVSISSNNDEFSDTSIEGLGGFIGTFFDLFKCGTLSNQISDFRAKLFGSEGLGTFRDILKSYDNVPFCFVDLLFICLLLLSF